MVPATRSVAGGGVAPKWVTTREIVHLVHPPTILNLFASKFEANEGHGQTTSDKRLAQATNQRIVDARRPLSETETQKSKNKEREGARGVQLVLQATR